MGEGRREIRSSKSETKPKPKTQLLKVIGDVQGGVDADHAASKPVIHSTALAETFKTGTVRNNCHGICEVLYSITEYSRPQVFQEVHGARLGR